MTLQRLAALALLGTVPVLTFVVGRNTPLVALAAVNVVIIATSLYLMWGPSEATEHAPAHG
ncbi:MAG: hypothetical protein ABEJ06_02930 [Haloarculaceae archaeon]